MAPQGCPSPCHSRLPCTQASSTPRSHLPRRLQSLWLMTKRQMLLPMCAAAKMYMRPACCLLPG